MRKRLSMMFALVFFCVFFGSGISWAAQYTIKLAHIEAPTPDAQYQLWALKFKELAEEFSHGAIEVKIYPAGQLGSDIPVAKKVQMGAVQMQIIANNNLAALCPIMDLFTLPFLFKSVPCGVLNVLHNDSLREDISKRTEKANIRILAWSTAGMRNIMNSKHPILKPSDLKDLRIRVAKNPILIDTYKALGGNPIGIAPSETFSALQTRVVDGNDGSAAWAWNSKFYEVQKYLSITRHQMTVTAMIINDKFYNALPAKMRQILRRAAIISTEAYVDPWIIKFQRDIIKRFAEKGLKISYPDLVPFRKAVRPVWDKYAKRVGGWKMINRVVDMQKDCL